ncbi:MAG: tetratricopeptide repeat protein, partial [Bacteroidota bacterium]
PLSEFNEEVFFSMAITYQNMQNYGKAVIYFQKALDKNPNYEIAMEELTACLAVSGRLQEGADIFKGLIDKDPYSYAAWYNLGDVHCRLGSLEEALNAFDYCILIKDDFAPAHLDKAHVLAMLGEFEEAINKYIQTFEYYNPDGITYFNIAECYEKLEKMDEARTYYKKSVKLLPEMAQAWYGIALTLEYEERWYEAIHYVRKAIEKDHTNPEFWLLLADCEFNLNNITEAGELYTRTVEEFPSHIDSWLSHAHFLTETGNPDDAVDSTNRGLSVHPHCAELLYRQTVNLYAAGRIQEAYDFLAAALERDDRNYMIIFELMPSLRNDRNIIRMIASKSDI